MKIKKISKRQPLKQKYAIIKKVAAHKKKLKKIIKKTNIHNRRSTKKAFKIPDCIFKKDILDNVKRIKEQKKNPTLNSVENAVLELNQYDKLTLNNAIDFLNGSTSIHKINKLQKLNTENVEQCSFKEYLQLDCNTKQLIFEKVKNEYYTVLQSKYEWIDELLDVIKRGDMIFYILDVRNTLLYFENDIIQFIRLCKKEVILILNKCDLVDNALVQQWLTYFRNHFITFPFISNYRESPKYLKKNKGKKNHYTEEYDSQMMVKKYVSILKKMIPKFSQTSLVFGLIGHVYSGRKSFVNTLTKEVGYASITKESDYNKEIKLNDHIYLWCKPGLILKKELQGLELIKKVHVMTTKEKGLYLVQFTLSMELDQIISFFSQLKQKEITYQLREAVSVNDGFEVNRVRQIVEQFYYEDIETEKMNTEHIKFVFDKVFNNDILFYVIPKTVLVYNTHEKLSSYFFKTCTDFPISQTSELMDAVVFSQKKKGTNYIMIRIDLSNNWKVEETPIMEV